MPNHLHLFLGALNPSLAVFMSKFKRWTGGRANRVLGHFGQRFWQAEWFDHWSRSPAEDERIRSYIRNNPVTAGLARSPEDWPYGSCGKQAPLGQ